MTGPKTQRHHARGKTLVLVDIGIVLVSSVVFTSLMSVATGAGVLVERVPALLMVVTASWALYAGYTPVRWAWVVINLGLAAGWTVSLFTTGGQGAWLAILMASGHSFVGVTLALTSSVRRFLAARKTSRPTGGSFDPAYTATLAFLGCAYLWSLGGVRDLLGWGASESLFTILTVSTLGGLGLLCLVVSAMRFVGLPLARPATTIVSFLLAVVFPFGTAIFLYWYLKVRERERTTFVSVPPSHMGRQLEGPPIQVYRSSRPE